MIQRRAGFGDQLVVEKKGRVEVDLEQNLISVLEVRTAGDPDDEDMVAMRLRQQLGRQHLFKQDLQELVNDLGIEIRVAHDASHCSKYNPIERRLFLMLAEPTRECCSRRGTL